MAGENGKQDWIFPDTCRNVLMSSQSFFQVTDVMPTNLPCHGPSDGEPVNAMVSSA